MKLNSRDKQILNIALPSIISNITVPLLGLIDLGIVGHMGHTVYIGAIAVGSMIFNVIYWIFGFLRMGTSGMTSQSYGNRRFSEVVNMLIRSLFIAFCIALCFLILQVPLKWLALFAMQPSEDISTYASTYFNICIWGAPAVLGLYGFTGWYIGMQNTRIPMIVSIFQNIVNIVLSVVLVYAFGMKIEGVAIGTLLAQWCGFFAALFLCIKHYSRLIKYVKRDLSIIFERHKMMKFFSVNRDIFIRTLFMVAVFLFFTSAGAKQGDVILAVNTMLMTMFTLSSYVMDGFANAGEALSGKYYGANNHKAFSDVCKRLMIWGIAVSVVFSLMYASFGDILISLLTNDNIVRNASNTYFWWAVFVPICGVAAFIYDGIFIGITTSRGMLLSSVIAAIIFFVIFYIFRPIIGNHALWLAFNIYLVIRGVVQAIYMKKIVVFNVK